MNMEDCHHITIKEESPNDDGVDTTDMIVEAIDDMYPVSNGDNILKEDDQVKVKSEPESDKIYSAFKKSSGHIESIKPEIDSMKESTGSAPLKDKHDFTNLIKQEYPYEALNSLVKNPKIDIGGDDLDVSLPLGDENLAKNTSVGTNLKSYNCESGDIKQEPNDGHDRDDDISDFSTEGRDGVPDTESQNMSTEASTSNHEPRKKLHDCKTCNKSFITRSKLKMHEVVHSSERNHKCDICDKCFKLASNLKAHKVTHTGGKPHQCEVCKRFFTRSSNLKAHKLTHSDEAPHQ